MQTLGPRNTNRIRGSIWRVSRRRNVKPEVIRSLMLYMRRVCEGKVTRLTPGGLRICHGLEQLRSCSMCPQKSAEGIVGREFDQAEGPNRS